MLKHTPSPWQFGDVGPDEYYADFQEIKGPDGNYPLALVFRAHNWAGGLAPEGEFNAELIVTSPELLEVLIRAERVLNDELHPSDPLMIDVRAVIAKATGAAVEETNG